MLSLSLGTQIIIPYTNFPREWERTSRIPSRANIYFLRCSSHYGKIFSPLYLNAPTSWRFFHPSQHLHNSGEADEFNKTLGFRIHKTYIRIERFVFTPNISPHIVGFLNADRLRGFDVLWLRFRDHPLFIVSWSGLLRIRGRSPKVNSALNARDDP